MQTRPEEQIGLSARIYQTIPTHSISARMGQTRALYEKI